MWEGAAMLQQQSMLNEPPLGPVNSFTGIGIIQLIYQSKLAFECFYGLIEMGIHPMHVGDHE